MSSLTQELRDGLKKDPVTMTFGPDGFFGYAPCTKSALEPSAKDDNYIMWWSTYEAEQPPARDMSLADLHSQLINRHGSWKLPYDTRDSAVYPSILNIACGVTKDEKMPSAHKPTAAERNVLVLPRYITPRLPSWCTPSGRIILIGDAAHAMPPDSGQGVSCAVEDGLAIGILLEHYLSKKSDGAPDLANALENTRKGYETVRMPRVGMILDMAKRMGNQKKKQTWFQEKVRDCFMWVLCESHLFNTQETLFCWYKF